MVATKQANDVQPGDRINLAGREVQVVDVSYDPRLDQTAIRCDDATMLFRDTEEPVSVVVVEG